MKAIDAARRLAAGENVLDPITVIIAAQVSTMAYERDQVVIISNPPGSCVAARIASSSLLSCSHSGSFSMEDAYTTLPAAIGTASELILAIRTSVHVTSIVAFDVVLSLHAATRRHFLNFNRSWQYDFVPGDGCLSIISHDDIMQIEWHHRVRRKVKELGSFVVSQEVWECGSRIVTQAWMILVRLKGMMRP